MWTGLGGGSGSGGLLAAGSGFYGFLCRLCLMPVVCFVSFVCVLALQGYGLLS